MQESSEVDPVYKQYRSRIRKFLSELAFLPPNELTEITESLEEERDIDLAFIYLSGITRVSMTWLIWEDYCRARHRYVEEKCLRITEKFLDSSTSVGGVSSRFNSYVKSLIAKMYSDLSPGIAIPSWIVTYSSFTRSQLVLHLAGLPLREQLRRFPVFVASLGVIDPVFRALLDYYATKASDFAYVSAEYIYWEVIRPCTLFYTASVDELGCNKCMSLDKDIYDMVLSMLEEDDTEPPRIGLRRYLEQLLEEISRLLLRRLREEKLRALHMGH